MSDIGPSTADSFKYSAGLLDKTDSGAVERMIANVVPAQMPATPDGDRTIPMSLRELSQRFMDDQDVRSDKVRALLANYDLRHECGHK